MPLIGTPIGTPSADDVLSESNVGIVVPPFSHSYDDRLAGRTRCARLQQGVASSLQLSLLDTTGRPIDLTRYGLATGESTGQFGTTSGSSSSISEDGSSPTSSGIAVKVREASEQSCVTQDLEATILNAESGVIRITISEEVYSFPAVYLIEAGLLNAAGTPFYLYPCYAYLERSNWNEGGGGRRGPPPVDSIRLGLRDSDMYENMLIDTLDFDMAEIAAAAVRTVKLWNDTPPDLVRARYTTSSFPFDSLWLEGIQLFLFQMAEEHYRRNKLPYRAGNTDTDDKNKDREYKAAWQERYQELTRLIRHQKAAINVRGGWFSLRSR